MKIRYIGDNPANTSFGIFFPRDTYVEVTDILACNKLSNNPCFEVMPGEEIEEASFEEVPKKTRKTKKLEAEDGNSSGSEEESSN